MPAMTHVLIQDHNFILEDWLAATDRQSVTRCRYYRPLTSTERQICLEVRGHTQRGVCGALNEFFRRTRLSWANMSLSLSVVLLLLLKLLLLHECVLCITVTTASVSRRIVN